MIKLRIAIATILLLVVSFTSYLIYDKGYTKANQEQLQQSNQNYKTKRKKIDEATSTSKSPDTARERLRDRQTKRKE
jgi:Tfp pilus assembly protein PilN